MKNVGSYPNTRMRRNRKTDWSRRLIRESDLSPNDLIWPIFIKDGKNIKEPIKTMPGVYRYSLDKIEKLVERAINNKIPMIALFPSTPLSKKNKNGSEAKLNDFKLFLKSLEKNLSNQDALYKKKFISEKEYQDSKLEYDRAFFQLNTFLFCF